MINDHMRVKSNKNKRFADLAKLGEIVFHVGDLANIWGIKSRSTLSQTLSRYCKLGYIKRIYKGFYSLKNPGELDPYLLGIKAMHTYAYVSCESVLAKHGIINQSPTNITVVSNVSRRYEIAGKSYRSRKLSDRFLYNDAGIEKVDSVAVASVARAVADILYFNPRTYFDAQNSKSIDWNEVQEISGKVGYNIRIPR